METQTKKWVPAWLVILAVPITFILLEVACELPPRSNRRVLESIAVVLSSITLHFAWQHRKD